MSKHKFQTILVTGVAGFIGAHVAERLLQNGYKIIGVDNLNAYYSVRLKQLRLEPLNMFGKSFAFHKLDIADHEALCAVPDIQDVDCVVHLAAQAGVRHSIKNPFAYAQANLLGHLSILEFVRHAPKKPRLVYASSSSVYGANTKVPFCETDPVTQPVSLYAATKRSDEMMSEAYSKLYNMEQIGLRFFTVYGPWGRPDMAPFLFLDAIFNDRPIDVFNHGKMTRDFTFIDDLTLSLQKLMQAPPIKNNPVGNFDSLSPTAPHRVVNIGNADPIQLMDFIRAIETATGEEFQINMQEMQAGDMVNTCADTRLLQELIRYQPTTSIENGVGKLVDWYRSFYKY